MTTLFTTSFILRCLVKPKLQPIVEYFKDLEKEELDIELNIHPDNVDDKELSNVWIFTLTYPAYQAQEFALRMMKFVAEQYDTNIKLVNLLN